MQIKKHGVVVRRKIHFWEKRRWGDWQKEFMWTVQRIIENAVSSPNYFSLPHPPSHLKNQIPPSLFPLLSHPLSQTWIGNTPALRCFNSLIFKLGPHRFIYFCFPATSYISQPQWVPWLFQWKSHSSSQEAVWLIWWNKLLLSALSYFPEKQAKKFHVPCT